MRKKLKLVCTAIDIPLTARYNSPMTTSPDDAESKPILRVKVAHFVDARGEQPVGVRVVEPPPDTRQALRGNIYAIVELTGDDAAREDLSERMLSALQRTYYTATGSQSQVLRQAVASARRKLDEFNRHRPDAPMEGGVICAGLVQNRLMLLHSGPALALIASGSIIERYPADILNFDAAAPGTEPAIHRQDLSGGGALFIGGAGWLGEVPLRTLAATVAYIDMHNCTEAARGLREQYALSHLPGLLVVVEASQPRSEISSVSDAEAVNETDQTPPDPPLSDAGPRPVTPVSGLPTAVNAAPPVRSVPEQGAADDIPPSPEGEDGARQDRHPQDAATAAAALSMATAGESAHAGSPVEDAPDSISREYDAGAFDAPTGEEAAEAATNVATTAALAASAQAGVQRAKELFGNILPDRRPASLDDEVDAAHPAPPPVIPSGGEPEPPAPSHVERALAQAPAEPFAPPPPTRGGRARLFALLALLILVLIPVLVAAVYWRKGASQNAEYETRIEMAEARLAGALTALDAGDKATGRAELVKAQQFVDEAAAMSGPSARTDELNARIQQELQEVLQVRPLPGLVEPLVRFPGDAQPYRVLVVDQDIYVLDIGRQVIERYRLDNTREFVPDPTPIVVLRAGETIDGVTVGRLVDFAWQPPIPGYEDKANLLVLDRNNQFFRYNARVEGASHVEVGDPTALQVPNNIEVYNGRTYVADEGVQQILRYGLGSFSQTPDFWFAEQTTANLVGLLSMAIDGDIWLLYSNGMLLRYASGEQVPFSLEGGAAQLGEAVDMALGPGADSPIYLADAAQDRIVVFDKRGAYMAQLVSPEGDQLQNLSGLYIDEVAGSLYILTQSALFQHPLPY